MKTPIARTRIAAGLLLLASAISAPLASAQERAAIGPSAPIEPSYLFTVPTGNVVRSMDVDISAAGVLFGQKTVSGLGRAALGLGDIAEMEIGTMDINSDLRTPKTLTSLPAGGLKVYLPLWKYAHGISASFRRSSTYETEARGQSYSGKVGEFYAVVSAANYPLGRERSAGWNGIKVKGHLGMKYTDASLESAQVVEHSLWRPVAGFEVWRNNERARIVGEIGWSTRFRQDGQIDDIRVITGGVRYFFSKHVTFDIGVRHQDNYGGLAESMIQTRLHMALPTHALRDRVVGIGN